jgi:hypothetical protein
MSRPTLHNTLDWVLEWIICLPLTLADTFDNKLVRALGFFLMCPWTLIIIPVMLFVLMPMLLMEIFKDFVFNT